VENFFRDSANFIRAFSWRTLNHKPKPDEREVGIDRVLPPARGIPVSVLHGFQKKVAHARISMPSETLK
jgi:hypothetical protein